MITAIHALMYAQDADAARAFFRDVLGFPAVEAGSGGHSWLILTLPPAELGVHPADEETPPSSSTALYLMCEDITRTVSELKAKGVEFTQPVADRGWGLVTSFKVPGAGEMSIYQPRHATAYRK